MMSEISARRSLGDPGPWSLQEDKQVIAKMGMGKTLYYRPERQLVTITTHHRLGSFQTSRKLGHQNPTVTLNSYQGVCTYVHEHRVSSMT